MKQTLVIGSTVVDIIINIPKLPKTGEDVHISKQTRSLGGCAYLTSDILRHFQVPYSLSTAVGGGIYGKYVYEKLQDRGVPIYIRREEKENGCCYCMVEDGGERTFIVDHGVEYTFYESYLENMDTDAIDSVYICGLEIEEYTGMNIIKYLKKHSEYKIYFAPGPRIMKIPIDRMNQIFALHPVIHFNETEMQEFTGEKMVEEGARVMYSKTQRPVIITLGDKGAYCFDGHKDIYTNSVSSTVVDTIGAGDAHIGGIISAQRLGLSYEDSLIVANHISSAVVSVVGGVLENEAFQKVLKSLSWDIKNKIQQGREHIVL